MQQGFGFTQIKSDQLINQGKTIFAGLIIEASADPGDVTIYDGLDTSSGRLFGKIKGLANDSKIAGMPAPVHFDSGLYIDVGSNITGVTVIWLPVRDE